jgi:hypothetical protein
MMAVGHSILVMIYHDLDGNYFDERDRQATEKRLM